MCLDDDKSNFRKFGKILQREERERENFKKLGKILEVDVWIVVFSLELGDGCLLLEKWLGRPTKKMRGILGNLDGLTPRKTLTHRSPLYIRRLSPVSRNHLVCSHGIARFVCLKKIRSDGMAARFGLICIFSFWFCLCSLGFAFVCGFDWRLWWPKQYLPIFGILTRETNKTEPLCDFWSLRLFFGSFSIRFLRKEAGFCVRLMWWW